MRCLILGVSGQDGSYLAEHLLAEGHEVFGMVRRPKVSVPGARLLFGDLLDQASLEDVLTTARPDEVYNLAAVTAPGSGWTATQPPLLAEVTGMGVARLCAAMLRVAPDARLVHASSSAVYDVAHYGPYGAAKVFAHEVVAGNRARLHASNAVLFSHTSPRQDPRFLAPTVCRTLARFAAGSGQRLTLTDTAAARDWSFAGDVARALPLIARMPRPGDVVVASGRQHSVRELVNVALAVSGVNPDEALRFESRPPMPAETPADITRLAGLGWKPETTFADMIALMVEAEVAACR